LDKVTQYARINETNRGKAMAKQVGKNLTARIFKMAQEDGKKSVGEKSRNLNSRNVNSI
jgi:hypothetical protein